VATLRIVHLSDLHFVPDAAKKSAAVWNAVCAFVNDEVRPQAVLVTGDVTDSATHPEFEHARRCLDELKVQGDPADERPWAIVAGNHDRFLYRGNGTPPWYTGVVPGWWRKDKAQRFDGTFKAFPQAVADGRGFTLRPPPGEQGERWRVRVVGLDSSERPQWFAQGAVTQPSIAAACRGALADAESDLVIALVHHHVLPIPALEQRAESGSLAAALNATGMLNAGTLLDALSAAQVDLLLHGHEHVPHRAHFSGSDPLAGRVAILSAGSGTGDATLAGWALERVHFNVIELDDDRSVWLRQVSGEGGQLHFVEGQGERIPLLRAEDIRSSRFVRRLRRQQLDRTERVPLPTSRIHKVVEFSPQRDIVITESLTHWQVGRVWRHSTANGSGVLGEADVRFDWAGGGVDRHRVSSVRDPKGLGRRVFALELPGSSDREAERLTSQFTWHGGGVLTRSEHDSLPDSARSGPRRDGFEFAAVWARGEFESLRLTVRLPGSLAPIGRDVQAFYCRPEDPAGLDFVVSTEIGHGIEFCGDGHIELNVSHPIPRFRYGLRWPVRREDSRGPEWQRLHRRLLDRAADVLAILDRRLDQRGWRGSVRRGLYLERPGDGVHRLMSCGNGDTGLPFLSLRQERTLARCVYWGAPMMVYELRPLIDQNDTLPGEQRLAVLPLTWSDDPIHEALGLLRIAWVDLPADLKPVAGWESAVRILAAEVLPRIAALARGEAADT
jgi:3',5'-cyclic AMP phosphodiesterase CpdA